jgi:hypothetical protein
MELLRSVSNLSDIVKHHMKLKGPTPFKVSRNIARVKQSLLRSWRATLHDNQFTTDIR